MNARAFSPRLLIVLVTLAATELAFAGSLEYAAAPLDNPLRGLVPYTSASGKARFPHSMEFCYFPLAELMQGAREFDWATVDKTLDEVSGRGNQLVFRVYCEYPGKGPAVPAFLMDAGLQLTKWTNESDGKVSYTPDYENDTLRKALAEFVLALGKRYDGDPRVAFITAGLLGSWGEWHTSPRNDLSASKEVQREIMDLYAHAFTKTKILLRYPTGANSSRYADNHERPFGYHDDSFCWATLVTGREKDSWFFEPSMKAAGATEKWKLFPIGGEIRPELWRQSFTAHRHPRDQGFVECVERLHVTWLMDSGLFDLRFPMDQQRKESALQETAHLGYELYVSNFSWEEGVLTLTVENRGVAPFYYDWPVEIEVGGKRRMTDWKVSGILPGEPRKWSINLARFDEFKIRISNPMKGGKPLRFANRDQGKDWLVLKP